MRLLKLGLDRVRPGGVNHQTADNIFFTKSFEEDQEKIESNIAVAVLEISIQVRGKAVPTYQECLRHLGTDAFCIKAV